MGAETIAIISLVAGAVGAGVSYAGQQQAAKTQSTFALLNAQSGLAQAQMQSRLAVSQAAFQTQQAKNTQTEGAVNAAALRNEADTRERAARINIARAQEDQARFQSMLLAKGGASGTVNDTGSPLDILVYSGELEHAENAEALYQTSMQASALRRSALAEELGADRAGIQGEIYGMEGLAQASAYRAQGVQAQLEGISGVQTARGASLASLGGLFGGVSNLAWNRAQSLRWTGSGASSALSGAAPWNGVIRNLSGS